MRDEALAAAVAGAAWEPDTLTRIDGIIDEVGATLRQEIGQRVDAGQFADGLARYAELIRVALESELGDGTELRAEALFLLARGKLAQISQEMVGAGRSANSGHA